MFINDGQGPDLDKESTLEHLSSEMLTMQRIASFISSSTLPAEILQFDTGFWMDLLS